MALSCSKSLPAVFRGIASTNNGDFYCLNCFHSYFTLNKLKKHERLCNNYDYCCIDMPKEHTRKKVITSSFYNSFRFRMFIKKKHNIAKIILKILTQKKTLSTNLRDMHGVQYAHLRIRKDCIEKFCKDLKELGMEMINFKKKE